MRFSAMLALAGDTIFESINITSLLIREHLIHNLDDISNPAVVGSVRGVPCQAPLTEECKSVRNGAITYGVMYARS